MVGKFTRLENFDGILQQKKDVDLGKVLNWEGQSRGLGWVRKWIVKNKIERSKKAHLHASCQSTTLEIGFTESSHASEGKRAAFPAGNDSIYIASITSGNENT